MKTKLLFLTILFLSVKTLFAQLPPGSLDPLFGNNGLSTVSFNGDSYGISAAFKYYNGKILVAGGRVNSSNILEIAIARLNENGTLDTTFGTAGKVIISNLGSGYSTEVKDIYSLNGSDNAPFFVLADESMNCVLYKFSGDGTIDNSFGIGGKATVGFNSNYYKNSISISSYNQITDTITIIGRCNTNGIDYNAFMARFVGGLPDATFGTNGLKIINTPDTDVYVDSTVQQDNKILIVGVSENYAVTPNIKGVKVMRLLDDGTIDTTFGNNGSTTFADDNNESTSVIALQSDGKIVVGYTKYISSKPYKFCLARLLSNGAFDTTFGENGAGINSYGYANNNLIRDVIIDEQDKIIVAGDTYNDGEPYKYALFRVSANGSTATDFSVSSVLGQDSFPINKLVLIPNSFVLGIGSTNFNLGVTKTFLKIPTISILGTALSGWNTDVNLTTSEGLYYNIYNLNLSQGEVKFRQDGVWPVNWGGQYPSDYGYSNGPNIQIPQSGVYNVSLNRNSGFYVFTQLLGTNENNYSKLLVYPNPTTTILKFQTSYDTTIDNVIISDTNGKIVLEQKNVNQVNVANLPNGIYFVELYFNEEKFIQKFIKE